MRRAALRSARALTIGALIVATAASIGHVQAESSRSGSAIRARAIDVQRARVARQEVAPVAGAGEAGAPVGVVYEGDGTSSASVLDDSSSTNLNGAPIADVSPVATTQTDDSVPASPIHDKPIDVPSPVAPPTGITDDSTAPYLSAGLDAPDGSDGVGDPPADIPDDTPIDIPTDRRNCKLLGPFALFIQGIMGVVVVGSLVLKRQREKPKRPWKVWTLDVSKQMLGQLFVHILNIFVSWVGSLERVGSNNPCSLYFINIAVDTTVGVLFIYYCMRFLTHYFTDVLGLPGFVSGQYTTTPSVIGRRRRSGPRRMSSGVLPSPSLSQDPHTAEDVSSPNEGRQRQASQGKAPRPRMSFFFKQLALYLMSLFLMKVMVLVLFAIFPVLVKIGRSVLDLFGEDRRAQVLFVMAVFPLLMNTMQFWLIDSVLRHNPHTSRYLSEEDEQLAQRQQAGNGDIEAGTDTQHIGESNQSWWSKAFGLSDSSSHRGGYQEISAADAPYLDQTTYDESVSDDEGSQHKYPPISSSTSSSLAALDGAAQRSSGAGQAQQASKHAAPGETAGKARSPGLQSPDARKRDSEEAWDAWGEDDEDSKPTQDDAPAPRERRESSKRKKVD